MSDTSPTPPARPAWSLRAAKRGDEPFLRRLFAATRTQLTGGMLGFTEAQRQALLDQQYDLRERHYRHFFPKARDWVVVDGTGAPIGRVQVDERPDGSLHLIDLALLPERRGQGLGGAILGAMQARRRAIHLNVDRHNRALRLYERMGFQITGEQGPDWAMLWQPPA